MIIKMGEKPGEGAFKKKLPPPAPHPQKLRLVERPREGSSFRREAETWGTIPKTYSLNKRTRLNRNYSDGFAYHQPEKPTAGIR